MADMVQERLDSMVSDLRDLLEKGIFTETEIHAIVERRRQSEYLLRRKNARKADFLRYAEAEMALERLRSIRHTKAMEGRLVGVQKEKFEKFIRRQKKKIGKEQEGNKNQNESLKIRLGSSPGDTSIIRSIHLIFVRIKRKWKSDVSLHLAHAEFAKRSKSYQQLGTIYAEALQILPKTAALWIEAASHEFFGYGEDDNYSGGSVHAARVLLQRGLRLNPNSEDLWIQYFALEWHFIQKMRGRKEILKLDAFENDQPTQMLSEDPMPAEGADFFQGSIPAVIYNNAIKTIPNSVSFRLKFLEVCKDFPNTTLVEENILTSVERDFGDNPDAWIVKATFALSRPDLHTKSMDESFDIAPDDTPVGFLPVEEIKENESELDKDTSSDHESPKKKRKLTTNTKNSAVKRACAVLEEATSKIVTVDMFFKSFEFLQDLLNSVVYNTKRNRLIVVPFLERLMAKADSSDVQSPRFLCLTARFLSEIGRIEDAIQLLSNATSGTHAKEPELWLLLADLTFRRRNASLDNSESTLKQKSEDAYNASLIVRKAMLSIPMHDSSYVELQVALFEYLLVVVPPCEVSSNKELIDLFGSILLLCSQRKTAAFDSGQIEMADLVGELCLKYTQVALLSGGISAARNIYDMIFFRFLPNLQFAASSNKVIHFFQVSLQIEKTAAGTSRKGEMERRVISITRLRRMYDAILTCLKQSAAGVDASIVYRFQQLQREDMGHFAS
eukprot:CAMPEP_0172435910 /NCGR_PEP_ID=MMETSP1064-20121228/71443_1 /TAXON_ID=202472 /ORGANISM="Aulacoseira subarctica , Strain CCAP 1002/5" /LENGTH=727 /DNA_ID=CAMNT_0013184279 /DNA_START=182 /DNA_END=2365 /DNA_ORIENTATION=+